MPPDHEWLIQDGIIEPCKNGLHACERALDAFMLAPDTATHICRVELGGTIVANTHLDCHAASQRRILWRADPYPTLRYFGRLCALDGAHRWDMPASVRAYLETGDRTLQPAAEAVVEAARDHCPWVALEPTIWAVSRWKMPAVMLYQADSGFSGPAMPMRTARLETMMLALEPRTTAPATGRDLECR